MSGRAVWLVGMMGAGKSTIGPLLAEALSRPFVDTDAEVEAEAGQTIAEIFAERGEAAFRELERRAVERAAAGDAVVALGGGAIAQPGAPARLCASGTVVYLRAGPETLLARIGRPDSRPLLRGLDREARVRKLAALLAEREAAYRSAGPAGVEIDVERGTPHELARELAARILARERERQAAAAGQAGRGGRAVRS